MNPSFLEALSKVIETAKTYADKGQTRLRRKDYDWSCSIAGKFLEDNAGTIAWVGSDQCDFRYRSIWEYCAAEHFGKDQKAMEKARIARDYASEMENGFSRLKERLLEQGLVLFIVPRNAKRRNIAVITLDPAYVVNDDPDNPVTAAQIQRERDQKLVTGQLTCSHHRLSRMDGAGQSRQKLHDSVEQVTAVPVSLPTPGPLPALEGAPA